jgi:hypothetical protein
LHNPFPVIPVDNSFTYSWLEENSQEEFHITKNEGIHETVTGEQLLLQASGMGTLHEAVQTLRTETSGGNIALLGAICHMFKIKCTVYFIDSGQLACTSVACFPAEPHKELILLAEFWDSGQCRWACLLPSPFQLPVTSWLTWKRNTC